MDHRWIARIAVAALHLGLFAALWLHRPPAPDKASAQRLTTVRLILPRPQLPPPPAPQTPRAQHQPAPGISTPRPAIEAAPAPATASPLPAAPEAEAAPAEPARTALRLTLPPGFAASSPVLTNPALNDPRSNTAKRTLESRIADAAENTGPWVSERTSDHRTLLRRGDTCVEMFRSRIADSNPFNNSVAPITVPMFGKPYKCK